MAYDETKDKLIKEEVIDEEYRVALFQYDENDPKIVVQKWTEFTDRRSGEEIKAWGNKVGRMTKEVAKQVVDAMQRFLNEL